MNPLSEPLECLNLAFPKALEEEIIDLCHAATELSGFTILAAAGFGSGASLHSTSEVVLGRSARCLLITVASPAAIRGLIASLQAALPTPDVAYWVTPVTAFGRLA
jgi:hypothetical protein